MSEQGQKDHMFMQQNLNIVCSKMKNKKRPPPHQYLSAESEHNS